MTDRDQPVASTSPRMDEKQFEELYRLYANDVLRVSYFYLGDLVLTDAGAAMTMVSVFSAGTQPAHPLSGPVWP